MDVSLRSTAGGRVLKSTKRAPLLVLSRYRNHNQLTKNKSLGVTPFWHNDARSRVTVTFGARRPGGLLQRWAVLMPKGALFESMPDAENRFFAEGFAQKLQTDREFR
jgi:hypothetical protein